MEELNVLHLIIPVLVIAGFIFLVKKTKSNKNNNPTGTTRPNDPKRPHDDDSGPV